MPAPFGPNRPTMLPPASLRVILFSDLPEIHAIRQLEKLDERQGSIRCLIALTHDLGYPLKKIQKINRAIGKILPFFSIESYQEFDFAYSGTQSAYIDKFIEFLGMEFTVQIEDRSNLETTILDYLKTGQEKKLAIDQEQIGNLSDEQLKTMREGYKLNVGMLQNRAAYFRYADDFELHRHGILSAYLLIKTLAFFKSLKFSYLKPDNIDCNHLDIYQVYAGNIILSAIADHTSEGYKISKINTPSALLIFVDELEEFSRRSRANQNRQFIYEFCKIDISAENGTLFVDFIFENEEIENLNPELAFKGRCKKFLSLLDIKHLDEEFKLVLRCIGRLPNNSNEYKLEIRRNFARVSVNGAEQNIPDYLQSRQFYAREEYELQS